MRRNIHVMHKNFRGIVLTKTLLGFEGRLNPAQLKEELEAKNVECSTVQRTTFRTGLICLQRIGLY